MTRARTLALALALSLTGRALAQQYTFTIVADSAIDALDPKSISAPSLSDAGYVAFRARTDDLSATRVLRAGPALAGPLAIIADSAHPEIGSISSTVGVNNLGQVSIWVTVSGPIDERILRGDGSTLTPIAQASDDDPFTFMSVVTSINDDGVVAWQGEINQPGFPQGLFTGDGVTVNTIFSTAAGKFTSSFAGPAINNNGQIAFRASSTSSDGDAIFRYDPDKGFVTIVQGDGPFNSAFDDEPDINNLGVVAVRGRSANNAIEYLIIGDGTAPAVPLVDTTGPLEAISNSSINDSGQIAFAALFDDFTSRAIFAGPDLEKDRVIATGDELDGSTVVFLSMYRDGFNNAGQIAFAAQLADGRAVVVVATPRSDTCAPDFNADGVLNSQDFFDFLAAFFAGDSSADFNADTTINSQDFFDFLAAFFAGC